MRSPKPEAVVVGASAGALEALSTMLPALPADFPLPILVVVHVPGDRKSLLAPLLRERCRVPVEEPDDKEPIVGGTVYIAPPDYHLLVEPERRISLSNEEAVHFSRPSIDVLFETAAEAYGCGLVGVVLSGANSDGAKGLRAILDAGGAALVQHPETALASAMPQAALDACPEAIPMSLERIAETLLGMVGAR